MLTQEETMFVTEQLVGLVNAGGAVRQTLVAPFIGTHFAEQIPDVGNVRALVLSTVNLCNTEGWKLSPSALRLLFGGLGLAALDAKLTEISDRITDIEIALREEANRQKTTLANPYQVSVLSGNLPFVNRRLLRQQVELLTRSEAQKHPILIVEGDQQSGKSYSSEYISHIQNSPTLSIVTYRHVFDRQAGLEVEAVDLARDLVSLMGRPTVDIPNNTNEKRYTLDLVLWVLNVAVQRQESQHWFILDNYGGSTLNPDTRAFLSALSSEVTNGVFQRHCRLILIGIDRDIVAVNDNWVIEDRAKPCTRDDVEATLSEILSRTPTVGLSVVAPFIFDNLPTDLRKMWELNRRLRLLMRAVNRLASLVVAPPDFKIEDLLLPLLDLPEPAEQTEKEVRRIDGLLKSQLDDLEDHLIQLRQP